MPNAPSQQRSHDRRALILDAALRTAVASGLSELSLQQVADAAGLAKSVVLYYFGDRMGLLTELAREAGGPLRHLHEQAQAAQGDPRGQLNEWIAGMFALAAPPASPWLLHAMLWSDAADARVREPLEACERMCCAALSQLLERGHAQYCWHAPDPDLAALVLRALVDGVLLRAAREPDAQVRARLQSQCRGAALDALVRR